MENPDDAMEELLEQIAAVAALARTVALFYRGLIDNDVPEERAGDLTNSLVYAMIAQLLGKERDDDAEG